MITLDHLRALIELAQRANLSRAERIFVAQLAAQIEREAQAAQRPPPE